MKRHSLVRPTLVAALALGAALLPPVASTQTPAFQSKPVLQTFVSGDDTKEAVMIAVSIAPGGTSGRHTHPGDCYGTVVEGNVEVLADGKEMRKAGPGDVYHNGRGVVHEIRNAGTTPVRAVHTLIIQKGQPRIQPAQ